MKTTKFSVPISMTAAFLGLVTCAVSCAKKSNAPEKPLPTPPPTPTAPSAATNAAATNAMTVPEVPVTITNLPATNVVQEITNPPPAETTIKAPDVITATDTNLPGHQVVVEMPTNAPAAPTNFYSSTLTPPTDNTKNGPNLCPVMGVGNTNYLLSLRVGYEHMYHGDNNDSVVLSARFYAYGDDLRESVGKNGWLIPDASIDISDQYLPKPDNNPHPGSDQGLRLRADFTWPWFHWTALAFAKEDSVCPFCRPLVLGLGPTVNVGFDHLYDETDFRFSGYAGARLTFNRSGFIEYTVGKTEGLNGTRQQLVAELPIYESRDGEVRYYLRGLWNHGSSNKPDVLEGGLFMEMPFAMLVEPEKWGDLVPFVK